MSVRTNFISTILAALFLSLAFALPVSTSAADIGLDEYLDLVKANHPLFRQESLSVDIERKQSESLLGSQDWGFSLTPSYRHLGKATASDILLQSVDAFEMGADFSRRIWSTGGQLGLNAVTNLIRRDAGIEVQRRYYHGFGAFYTQPLLQNMKGKLDRLAYELSKYSIDATKVQSEENRESFLADAGARYLEWVKLDEAVRIAEERLKLAREQLEQTDKRYKANLVDKVDVLRAEDAVRIAEQVLLQISSGWDALQAELAVTAGDDDIFISRPSYDIYRLPQIPPLQEALARLKERSRLTKALKIQKQQLAHQRTGLEEQKRAQLDLSVSAGLYGANQEFVQSFNIYQPDVSVGLTYSTLFGKRSINGQIEALDLQLRQLDEGVKSVEVNLEASMRGIFIQLRELENILELNRAQIRSAREKTEEEIKLYNQGRGQLTFVIQSRDNEENAKLTYADNAALYQALYLQYRALLDELLAVE